MNIEELKRKIKELDTLMDDESISNEQFDEYAKEAARLCVELARLEMCLELVSVKRLENLNEWSKIL